MCQSRSSCSWTLFLLYHLMTANMMIMLMLMLIMLMIMLMMIAKMMISSIIIPMVTVGGAGKNNLTGSCSPTGDLKLGEKLPGRILHFFDILEYSMWKIIPADLKLELVLHLFGI